MHMHLIRLSGHCLNWSVPALTGLLIFCMALMEKTELYRGHWKHLVFLTPVAELRPVRWVWINSVVVWSGRELVCLAYHLLCCMTIVILLR